MDAKDETRMTVRMPADLYEWLKVDAVSDLRSLNSQVVAILDDYRKKKQSKDQSDK